MKKFQITWKHSKENIKGEVQNQIPPQVPYIVEAKDEQEAKLSFFYDYTALYIHDVKEV